MSDSHNPRRGWRHRVCAHHPCNTVQGVDDREELAGIGAVVLDHRGVFQMLVEGGVAAAIASEPVGQEMRPGCDISGQKGTELGAGRGRQHGDAGITGKEAVLALDRMPCLPFRFFGAGTFSTAATTRLLSELLVLRPRLLGSPRPPMKVSSASSKPRSGRAGSSLSPWRSLCAMVHAV